jgi:polyisoprenyl-phosphate glycosyltransferase
MDCQPKKLHCILRKPWKKMSDTTSSPKLSAIIAVYLDALAVPHMYQRLVDVFHKIDVRYEIIFVNDCSPDNAREVLAEIAKRDQQVVVVNHTRNFGSQNAFTSGMKIATGDAVILLDGDLQDPPEVIDAFYKKWREGYQVVYGDRVRRQTSLSMQILYKAFYRIFSRVAYVRIPLDAGDFSLLDRSVVNALNNLPENNRFMRGLRAWVGYRQIGVPYVRPERMFGRTTNSFIKNVAWARKAILSFSYIPLEMITWIALIMVILSLIGIITQVVLRLLIPTIAPSGFTTLIILILLMGGIQLLCLSIIGAYLAHIYDEVKRRPPFLVESILNDPRTISEEQTQHGT